jgi:diguanylate cyclase (GGDEF)-like protein
VSKIEKQCDSPAEKQRIASVQEARAPYVQSYLRALHLFLDEHKGEAARSIMVQETTPALAKYHSAWNDFLKLEMDEMDRAAGASRAQYAKTRAFAVSMIVLAIFVAATIAVTVTRKMVGEIRTRMKAEHEVRALNAGAFLARELLRANRNHKPFAVFMIDLDHFKRFNDSFGHEAGDILLRELGALFSSQIRGGDIACRYGGEEFLIILTDANLDAARQRAETFKEQVRSLQVHYRGQTLRRVTISIGLAAYPDHGTSAQEMINAAERKRAAATESSLPTRYRMLWQRVIRGSADQ